MDEELTLRIHVTVHSESQVGLGKRDLEIRAPWEALNSLAYACGDAVQMCAYAAVGDALAELNRREAEEPRGDDLPI